ncbi:hypothetical protein CEP52_005238 [Fusarium oligoseptatum]|uniref:Uncharacterized protein n=1 Tax=Fusarium oligoseptatum TaxID=2604345 RepID=A0A428TZH8_9HYPO|nr:hypothetical protein CEP52_005238 [Fusarium oligoseptatum]
MSPVCCKTPEGDNLVKVLMTSDGNGNNKSSRNIRLLIESPTYMRAILNGRFASLEKTGLWFEADSTGVVNIVVPTSDLSSHNLYVARVREPGGREHSINEPIVRPIDKILDRLAKYKTGQQLKNAKTLDGKPIVASGQMTDKEADQAEDFGNSSSSGQATHGSQVRVQRHHRARRSIANWGFVKDWSNSVGAFVNAGLDVADDKMANAIRSILPDCLEKHGGGLDSFKDRGSSQGLNTANSNLDGISPFLTEGIDEVKAVINALGELAKTLGNDIWDLIRGKCSFGTLMERVGKDIADFVLEARRKIATHASRSLKNLLNRNLHLPIFSYLWKKLTGKDLTLLTLVSLLVRWPAASLHRASLGDKAVAPKWEGHLNKGNFEDLINNRVPWADAALTVKPFFESLQLATLTLDAITSFWDYTFDGVGLGAYSTEISIINGAVAAINILVSLPLPSDCSGVPGIPHHIISYLNGSTAVVDLIFKVLKWKKVMTPVVARRISTTWKVAVGLVIFGNEVFVEGWLITRHGRADRMYVGIQHEVFKLLGAGLSFVSAWTVDNQPEVARAAERNDGVNLTAMNGSSGVVQVMIKGGGNMTQLMMIPDRQWVADISGPEFADLVFGDGLSQEKQLEFPILRKELEFPILKQEVKVEVVEE